MLKHFRKFLVVMVVTTLLSGAIALSGSPVQAQLNTPQPSPLSVEVQPQHFTPVEGGVNTGDLVAQGAEAMPEPGVTPDPSVDGNPAAQADATATDAEPISEPTCESSVGTMGWIICPFIRMTFDGFNWLVDNVLEDGLLRIDLFDDGEQQLREAWAGFRTMANLVFVIAFFVIIYAEASGRFGMLESYSISRLLPKIVLSVIGIQLSFFISAYLVELFNDLGAGITQLVLAPVEGFSQFELSFTNFGEGSFFGLDAAVGEGFVDSFIGIGVVAIVGWIAYIVLETVLVLAVFGLALMFFTLILRKILIIAMVVISPFAFAMFVLPGTERIFKLWWDSFIKALAMYPLIMLFIASGQLVGRLAVAGDATFLDSMIGMIATFGPLFLIPATFKFAGTAVAAVGGAISNMAEKGKGDIRDPNSARSRLRQRRGQRYGRLLGGQARTPGSVGFRAPKAMGGRQFKARIPLVGGRSLMPSSIRRAYNRLPSTDSTASLMADIEQGRDGVSRVAKDLGDTTIKAAAVTGGGYMKGAGVRTVDGGHQWSGYAKLGNHFAYDHSTGQIATRNGIAQMFDENGQYRDSKVGDFYDADTMSQVRKYSSNRGFLAASAEHTMGKTDNNNYADQQQIWYGMDGSNWTKGEKLGMSNGVWAHVKDQGIHHKFSDFDGFYHDGPYDRHANNRDLISVNPTTGEATTDTMGTNFHKLLNFVDGEMQQYPIQNQKAPAWDALNKGLVKFATHRGDDGQRATALESDRLNPNPDKRQVHKLRSLAYKARNLVDQDRQMNAQVRTAPTGDDGNIEQQTVASGSGATGSAAREAKVFLQLYAEHIGPLPGDDDGLFDPPEYHP